MNAVKQPTEITVMPEPEPSRAITPINMLDRAVAQGADIAVLEKLMGLHERWEANQARKAFDAAIAQAKAEIPTIFKNKLVDFVGLTGKRTTYKHETLDEVLRTVQPILSKHGLDPRWRTESQPGFLTVICRLAHREGYAEENSLTAPVDTSGNKNAIQAIGSVQTYLQRYTLKAALGLAAAEDDDGRAAGGGETITDEQAHRILDMLNEDGADLAAFCRFMKVAGIAEIPAKRFDDAVKAINAARAARARRGAQA